VYIALEPYMRRRFPHLLMGWSAVLTGRVKDPIVGRDVLIGMTCGFWVVALSRALDAIHPSAGATPDQYGLEPLLGCAQPWALTVGAVPHSVRDSLLFLFLAFLAARGAAQCLAGLRRIHF